MATCGSWHARRSSPPRNRGSFHNVVQLLGEYVVESSSLILERLTAQSSFSWPAYREFVRANSAFIALTEQRAISYWSCYYRHDFARGEYPALVALDNLRQRDLG